MQIPRLIVAIPILLLLDARATAEDFSAADVYRDASSSVVLIFGFDEKGQGSAGSGSIIDSRGLVLTNDHVIFDSGTGAPYRDVKVYFKPTRLTGDSRRDLQTWKPAQVVARDRSLDLALLRVSEIPHGAATIRVGDSESAEIGSPVAAIGHPGGGGLWTLTTGTISSVRREGNRDVFQTDAAINPGNSGGPLLDGNARMIGVNTYVRRVNSKGLPLEGLNYSLRTTAIRDWLDRQGVELQIAASAEKAPAQAQPAAPSPNLPSATTPTPRQARPRSYRGADGSSLYGVPNPRFDPESARREAFARSRKNARDAFRELDEMSIRLDEGNF